MKMCMCLGSHRRDADVECGSNATALVCARHACAPVGVQRVCVLKGLEARWFELLRFAQNDNGIVTSRAHWIPAYAGMTIRGDLSCGL